MLINYNIKIITKNISIQQGFSQKLYKIIKLLLSFCAITLESLSSSFTSKDFTFPLFLFNPQIQTPLYWKGFPKARKAYLFFTLSYIFPRSSLILKDATTNSFFSKKFELNLKIFLLDY
jgi:hypothetical protein